MLPDRQSNPGPLTYESGALPIALRGPISNIYISESVYKISYILNKISYILNKISYINI